MTEKPSSPPPDQETLRGMAETLINAQSTMTLATAAGDRPWAAAVYYVYIRPVFYFFSDPNARHIQEAMAAGRASSAVHAEANAWQGIRGLQMSGKIEAVPLNPKAAAVIRAYLKKFPFTKAFFNPRESLDLSAFSRRFKVRLYGFNPDLVYYLDNSIKFGFREQVDLVS